MRYIALLTGDALRMASSAVNAWGGSIAVSPHARHLTDRIAIWDGDCLLIDPGLVTPAEAIRITSIIGRFPRPVVAFAWVTTMVLENVVVLAQRGHARFLFRGSTNEQQELRQALLLAHDSALSAAVLTGINEQMNRLPCGARDTLALLFQTGGGPATPDALAAATSLPIRDLHRCLSDAGLASAKPLLNAVRVVAGYRAITRSRMPLMHVSSMLGGRPRAINAQFVDTIGVSCGGLRAHPLPVDEVARRLVRRLTSRETHDGE